MLTEQKIRAALSGRTAQLREREDLTHSQFWRGGAGWLGAVPLSGWNSYQSALAGLEPSFAPIDVTGDIISFHTAAVAGNWSVSLERPLDQDEKPTDDEQARIDEAEALLTTWWDERDLGATLRATLEPLQWANTKPVRASPMTVSPVRLSIPEALTERDAEGNTVVNAADFSEAFDKLYVHLPSPLQAGALRDDHGFIFGHYYRYRIDAQEETEVCGLGRYLYPSDTRYRDICFVERRRGEKITGRATYDLGGMLLHRELTSGSLLVTDSLLSEQRQVNTTNTLKAINLKDHGFTQEDLLNVDLQGTWVDGSDSPISEEQASSTPGARFKPDDVQKGPNRSRAWEGVPRYSDDGARAIGRETPQVVRHTPSSSQEFRDGLEDILDRMYFMAKQAHRRISGDAVASGESRITAERSFQQSLEPSKRAYEQAVQWLLTTALRLAALLTRKPGYFDGLRVVCNSVDSVIAPSPERLRILSEAREKGNLDLETYLEQTGLSNDIDATIALMNAERILPEGASEKMALLFSLLEKGVVTLEQVQAEAVKLGLIEEPRKLEEAEIVNT